MSELLPRTRALVETARPAHEPRAADRDRVLGAVEARLAAEQGGRGRGRVGLAALGVKLLLATGIAAAAIAVALPARDEPPAGPTSTPSAAFRPSPPVVTPLAPQPPTAVSVPAAIPEQAPPAARRPAARRAVVATGDSLTGEIALLAQAREALRTGTPQRALSLVVDHDRRFPAGALREEFAATRVLALVQVGRPAEACVQARAFLRRWPESPLATQVAPVCPAP